MSNNLFILVCMVTLVVSYFLVSQNNYRNFAMAVSYQNEVATIARRNISAIRRHLALDSTQQRMIDILRKSANTLSDIGVNVNTEASELESMILNGEINTDTCTRINTPKQLLELVASDKKPVLWIEQYVLDKKLSYMAICQGISRITENYIPEDFVSRSSNGRLVKVETLLDEDGREVKGSRRGTRTFITVIAKKKELIREQANVFCILPGKDNEKNKIFKLVKDIRTEEYMFVNPYDIQEVYSIDDMKSIGGRIYRIANVTSSGKRKATCYCMEVADVYDVKPIEELLDKASQGAYSAMKIDSANKLKDNTITEESIIKREVKYSTVLGNFGASGRDFGLVEKFAVFTGKLSVKTKVEVDGAIKEIDFEPYDGQGLIASDYLASLLTEYFQEKGYQVIIMEKAILGLLLQARCNTDKGVYKCVDRNTFNLSYDRAMQQIGNARKYGYDAGYPDLWMDMNQEKWEMNKNVEAKLYVLAISHITNGNTSIQALFNKLLAFDFCNNDSKFSNLKKGQKLILDSVVKSFYESRNVGNMNTSMLDRPMGDILMSINPELYDTLPVARNIVLDKLNNTLINKVVNELKVKSEISNVMVEADWLHLLLGGSIFKHCEVFCSGLKDIREFVIAKYPNQGHFEFAIVNNLLKEILINRINAVCNAGKVKPINGYTTEDIRRICVDYVNNCSYEGNCVIPTIFILYCKLAGLDCDGDKLIAVYITWFIELCKSTSKIAVIKDDDKVDWFLTKEEIDQWFK